MPVNPTPQPPRFACQILTVDPSQQLVEVMLAGVKRRIIVNDTATAFRWPVANEVWYVYQSPAGDWRLGEIAQNSIAPEVLAMAPGDVALNSPTGVVHIVGSADGATDFTFTKGSFAPGTVDTGGTTTVSGGNNFTPVMVAADYAANPWDFVIVELSPASVGATITLPLRPPDGTQVGITVINTSTPYGALAQPQGTDAITQYGNVISSLGVNVNGPVMLLYETGTWYDISAGSAIDQPANIASLRTLGTGSQQALPGNFTLNTIAKAYLGTNIDITSGSWRQVPLNTMVYTSGHFDTTSHRYNPPTAGYYQINYNITGTFPGGGIGALTPQAAVLGSAIFNGTAFVSAGEIKDFPDMGMTLWASTVGSDIVYCTAGSYLELDVYWNYPTDPGLASNLTLTGGVPYYNYLSVSRIA